ncbi:MAG: TonB-dependent receptor, partial [Rhodothermales bacterium]|nr:TonB-dependent receptor [Rhodothermales bacterium]
PLDRVGVSAGLRTPFYRVDDTTFTALEPRISLRIGVSAASSVKASYALMHQYVHLIPSSTASLPTDIWTPASKVARPQKASQFALGYFQNLAGGEYEASVEGYYKDMRRQVLFREGTELLAFEEIDRELTFGRGWSYGAEVFVKRRTGRLSGWISYTLSWTRQRFAELNRGESFPFKYDRRHNLAAAAVYRLGDKWSVSANFVLLSGPTYTLPVGRVYASLGGELYQGLFYDYDRVNNFRMGAYHRLDITATRRLKPWFFSEGELRFGFYNIYSRQNPYFVYLDLDLQTDEPIAKQVALLPIIPSISYNVRF